MDAATVFAFGFAGGAVVQLLDIFALAKVPADRRDAWLASWFYWGAFVAYALVGGLVALAFELSGVSVQPLLALNVGAAWPLVLERGAQKLPELDSRID